MKAISLAPFTIRVKEKHKREDYEIDQFLGENDLLVFVRNFLDELHTNDILNEDAQRLVSVRRVTGGGRTLRGLFESGDYGSESLIKDVGSRAVVHHKARTHADMLPFYYLFSLPKGRTKGILLLQKRGPIGIVTVLRDLLQVALEAEHPNGQIVLSPLSTTGILDQYMAGASLNEIRFVRFSIPDDIAAAYGRGHEELKGSAEFVVRFHGLEDFPLAKRFRDFISGRGSRELQELVELKDVRLDYDTIKLGLTLNGRRRTINVTEVESMRGEFDITDTVELGRDGNPRFESIDEVAHGLLTDLEAELYGEGGA